MLLQRRNRVGVRLTTRTTDLQQRAEKRMVEVMHFVEFYLTALLQPHMIGLLQPASFRHACCRGAGRIRQIQVHMQKARHAQTHAAPDLFQVRRSQSRCRGDRRCRYEYSTNPTGLGLQPGSVQ